MIIVATKHTINAGATKGFSIFRNSEIYQLNALNEQGLTKLKAIANDEGVDEEPLTRAFRAALRKFSHPDDKDCDIFRLMSRNNLIIAGDLNAAHKTWNNTRPNNSGFRPKKIIQSYPNARNVASYTRTHINSRSRSGARNSIIDLAVFKTIPFNYEPRVIDDICSDHLPVILTLYTNYATMKFQSSSPPIGRTSDSFLKISHSPFRSLPAISISTLRLVGLDKLSPKHLWLFENSNLKPHLLNYLQLFAPKLTTKIGYGDFRKDLETLL
ncbi:hypothetical protein TNCV_3893251 [Trichonephila clavipes]|nr:hypothetical protein TNCV_3893251 [Trichonephila clavipes]